MIISHSRFAAEELPLVKPLRSARGVMTSRSVFVIALYDAEGRAGFGEAAPLPAYGTEGYDLAFEIFSRLAERSALPEVQPDSQCFSEWLREIGLSPDFAPASCWALECALASLAAAERSQPLAEFFGAKRQSVAVNALLGGGDSETIIQAASRAVTNGYGTLKLKVGVKPLREEIDLVRGLREDFPDVALRLDANGIFSLDEARQFAHAVSSSNIEYLEDPLAVPTPENLRLLRAAANVSIALDESLKDEGTFAEVVAARLCEVVVLKPAVVGSLTRLSQMAEAAHARQIDVVMSNLIESSLGLYYAALCAAALPDIHRAQGLGTASMLAQDTLTSPLTPVRGEISLPASPALTPRLAHSLQLIES